MSLTNADIAYYTAALSHTSLAKLHALRREIDTEIAKRLKQILSTATQDYNLHPTEIAYIQKIILDHQGYRASQEQSKARMKFDRMRKRTMAGVREDICQQVANQIEQKINGVGHA